MSKGVGAFEKQQISKGSYLTYLICLLMANVLL